MKIFNDPRMKIYMIRHTAVAVAPGICYGQTDVPVKATFPEEAAAVQRKLSGITPDAVFSSPLRRCVLLAEYCGYAPIAVDDRLKELHFGEWEGKAWNDIDMSVWESDWINLPAPGGESLMQMFERFSSFLDDLKEKNYRTVFLFIHGGIIGCARVYFHDCTIRDSFSNIKKEKNSQAYKESIFRKSFHDIPGYGEIVTFTL